MTRKPLVKATNPKQQSKICPRCGRSFTNRKRWAARGLWDSVVYCSEKCRKG